MSTTNGRYGGYGTFDDRLRAGTAGEDIVTAWARRLGFTAATLATMRTGINGGPRLLALKGRTLIAPDLMLMRDGRAVALEVKLKANFSLHRATGEWVTGIEARYFFAYCDVWNETGIPTFIGFYHHDDHRILGGEVTYLAKTINHRHPIGGGEMLFWSRRKLEDLAEHDAFAPFDPNSGQCPDWDDNRDLHDEPEPTQATAAAKKPVLDLDFGA